MKTRKGKYVAMSPATQATLARLKPHYKGKKMKFKVQYDEWPASDDDAFWTDAEAVANYDPEKCFVTADFQEAVKRARNITDIIVGEHVHKWEFVDSCSTDVQWFTCAICRASLTTKRSWPKMPIDGCEAHFASLGYRRL
jgi:hypothetical protein